MSVGTPVDGLPLAGRRVLVTRAPHQVSELAERLRGAGAEVLLVPTIKIAEPESLRALDAALECLGTYDWLVFTSANAVEAFERRRQFYRHTQTPKQIAAIGPATARAVRAIGLVVDLVPKQAVAESLAEELAHVALGRSFLLVRAADARDVVPDALRAAGGTVTIAEGYRNEVPVESVSALRQLLAPAATPPDAVTFTSASTVRNLAALLEAAELALPEGVVKASIGPVTSAAMRELGMMPDVEAREASVPALVEALEGYFVGATPLKR